MGIGGDSGGNLASCRAPAPQWIRAWRGGREPEPYDDVAVTAVRWLLTGGPRGAVQGRAAVVSTAARLRAAVVGIRDWVGGGVDLASSRSHAQSEMGPGAAGGPVTRHKTFPFTGRNG